MQVISTIPPGEETVAGVDGREASAAAAGPQSRARQQDRQGEETFQARHRPLTTQVNSVTAGRYLVVTDPSQMITSQN